MLRLLARSALNLIANAAGLLAAAVILSGFTITIAPFVIAVLIFTVVEVLAAPLLTQMSEKSLPALTGGVALVTTFVGLFVTTLLSDGITINGLQTWILATLIVWLFALIANLILPLILFKKVVQEHRNDA